MEEEYKKEKYEVKYIDELMEYWNAYTYALINEIFVGIAINLGMSEADAYKLAKSRPDDLHKANFFSDIFNKFKDIFNHKIPKFRYNKKIYSKPGQPMTDKQWQIFNNSLNRYWYAYAHNVAEEMGINSYLLGRSTTEFKTKNKPYKNKSLYQVYFDQYNGAMPKTLSDAYKKYDFNKSEKKALNRSYSNIAMYVTQTGNDVKDAIRHQVQSGLDNNKTPIEVASDLYWEVEKNKNLVNKYTAESLHKNWNRIAETEMAAVYEAGVLAPYEADAMESLKDSAKAKYFVRVGGTCDWCQSVRGTIARLVPTDIVDDPQDESLNRMGIHDPNTDIALWIGKNNIGIKKDQWLICCPAHPHNKATMQPIDLEQEFYNPKTDDVEHRQKKVEFVPQKKDVTYRSKEEQEYRKPTFIGDNLVRYNNNIYEAVSQDEYNKKLDEWRKDRRLPIPVNKKNMQDMKIFKEAEKI
jgi:hypothetical protein